MNIAICDDDSAVIGFIENVLADYFRHHKRKYTTDGFFSGQELLDKIQKENQYYDIYILDIEMEPIDGLSAARKIRERDGNAIIIFVTAHDEMALAAYDVTAFHFLVKPLDEEKTSQVLKRAVESIGRRLSLFRFIENRRMMAVPFSSIYFFESQKRKKLIHTTRSIYEFYGNMDELINQLDPRLFVQVHASFIINMEYIRGLERSNVILDNGRTINLTRKYKANFKRSYRDFVEERLW